MLQKLNREDKKMSKKFLGILLATAMVATTLVGCGAKTEEAAAPAAKRKQQKRKQLLQQKRKQQLLLKLTEQR